MQKAGDPNPTEGGSIRAGSYEIGQFYYDNGGVFYRVDAQLKPVPGSIGELALEHDLPNKILDGAQDAIVAMAKGLAKLITHPIQTISDLRMLPGAVYRLILNSPAIWDQFKAMPLGDQVRKASELVTTLLLMYGTSTGAASTLSAAAADVPDITINVLRLQPSWALEVVQVTVPVGTTATALSGGPGGIYILAMANQAGGGGSSQQGGGGSGGRTPALTVDPGVTLSPTEQAAAQHWVNAGHDVRALRPAGSQNIRNVRTADLDVTGVGRVDVYAREASTSADNMVRAILDKNSQTSIVHVEIVSTNATPAEFVRIPNRVFGHPTAGKNIARIIIRQDGQVVLDSVRR
jgi:hypothetical protein